MLPGQGFLLAFVMVVVMAMAVMMPMIMVMMPMIVVAVIVMLVIVVMMDAFPGAGTVRAVAEDQRFDGHRHRVRRNAQAPQIDEIKIGQHHAVDDQNIAFHAAFLAHDRANRLRHVAVEHDMHGFVCRYKVGQPQRYALCEAI